MVAATHVFHPGTVDNHLSVPDAAYWPTGDIDFRWVGVFPDWTPASRSYFLSRYLAGGDNRDWRHSVGSDGTIQMFWSPDGTFDNGFALDSTVGTGFTDGTLQGIRFTLDVDNGASDADLEFWTLDTPATDDPENAANWSPLGSTVNPGGTTSIHDGNATVGTPGTGNTPFGTHELHRLLIYDGIEGTNVLDIDPTQEVVGATSFTEESAQAATVTVNQDGGTPCELVSDAPPGGDSGLGGPEGWGFVRMGFGWLATRPRLLRPEGLLVPERLVIPVSG